jgi:hypothetical protein
VVVARADQQVADSGLLSADDLDRRAVAGHQAEALTWAIAIES